jgi:hypothetical protein
MAYFPHAERNTIDMSDAGQVLWWCRAFSVSREELWQAVRTVGNQPRDVGSYLRMETAETDTR